MKFIIKLPTRRRNSLEWVKEINNALWNLVFVLVDTPEDIDGAKCTAAILRYLFPFKVTAKDILEHLYPLRGWEKDLGVPFPYILFAIKYLRKNKFRVSSRDVLAKAHALFWKYNPTFLRTKELRDEENEGTQVTFATDITHHRGADSVVVGVNGDGRLQDRGGDRGIP